MAEADTKSPSERLRELGYEPSTVFTDVKDTAAQVF
jgi:hypothetical protein